MPAESVITHSHHTAQQAHRVRLEKRAASACPSVRLCIYAHLLHTYVFMYVLLGPYSMEEHSLIYQLLYRSRLKGNLIIVRSHLQYTLHVCNVL